MRHQRSLRRTVAVLAVASAALAVPTTASAAPVATGAAAAAQQAIAAAGTATDVAGPADLASLIGTANQALEGLGLTPFFYPTGALNCSAVPGTPLGIVPAVAGAAPGPYAIPGLPTVPGVDTNLVGKGETLFAFVPAGVVNDAADKTGMQVAWFNVNTFQGGFAEMGGLGETLMGTLLSRVPDQFKAIGESILAPVVNAIPSAGVRLAPVETGSGTVLAAVFGQVTHDGQTCAFLPTIGLTQVG
jgi:hypothetical protein